MTTPVGWGILGTANIARKSLLPALAANGGVAQVVGSRDITRAQSWAAEHGVARGTDYEGVLADPDVDIVYVALPNDQHVEWARRAVDAGKAVLVEKPFGLDAAEVATLTDGLAPDAPVWESFVFPFHPQTELIASLLPELGEPLQLESTFRFSVANAADIRLNAVGGGALYDVGCYSVRLARLLFGAEPSAAHGSGVFRGTVDTSVTAVLDFPADRRLVLSASIERPRSSVSRIVGSDAELRITHPFHPKPDDVVELIREGEVVRSWPPAAGTAFDYGVAHIQAAVRGETAPRHTAGVDAEPQAAALDLVRKAST